jgi:hypothetical protein
MTSTPPYPSAPVDAAVAREAREARNAAPLLLSYAEGSARRRPSSPLRLGLFVLSLPALVTPFVSFTWGTSPVDVVEGGWDGEWPLYLMALTIFAGLPIVLWKARRLAWAMPPARWETRVLAVAAVIVTLPAVVIVGRMLWDTGEMMAERNLGGDELLMLSLAVVALAGGLFLSAWRWRRRGLLFGLETCLVVGYVTVAVMCLLAFHEWPETGYWLTVPVTASLGAEMLLPPPPAASANW